MNEQTFEMDFERSRGHSTMKETCKQRNRGGYKMHSKNKEQPNFAGAYL